MDASVVGERRIVVGVDGSGPSLDALRWAVRQAGATGAAVEAVLCRPAPPGRRRYPASVDRAANDLAIATLNDSVREAARGHDGVAVRERIEAGRPGHVLTRRARGADLLVVGAGSRAALTGALPGSVARHCTGHAPCPVVVVRGRSR